MYPKIDIGFVYLSAKESQMGNVIKQVTIRAADNHIDSDCSDMFRTGLILGFHLTALFLALDNYHREMETCRVTIQT